MKHILVKCFMNLLIFLKEISIVVYYFRMSATIMELMLEAFFFQVF